MIRDQNQVLECAGNVMGICAKTPKKPAYVKIAVPDDFALHLLKQTALGTHTPISQLELVWKDDTIMEKE